MQAELLDTGTLARSIEAVLFVASESLSIKALAKLTGAPEADVTVALQQIDADFASRGIVLREVAGGYRLATAPDARAVVEAYLMPPKTNLSPAALETLAIVAYMQPVTKGDIEGIRGVSADSVLSTLVDRRFLVEAGRKDVAGRPILYKTTPEFLEAFGLRSLEELPPIDVDADAPIELAFPIATRALEAVDARDGAAALDGAAAREDTRTERPSNGVVLERADDTPNHDAAVDGIGRSANGAALETELEAGAVLETEPDGAASSGRDGDEAWVSEGLESNLKAVESTGRENQQADIGGTTPAAERPAELPNKVPAAAAGADEEPAAFDESENVLVS